MMMMYYLSSLVTCLFNVQFILSLHIIQCTASSVHETTHAAKQS